MKNILPFLLLFIFSFSIAQETQIIDANNVRARLHSSGLMFRDLDDLYGYTILDEDKNEIGSTMITGSPLFGIIDKNNSYQVSYGFYHPSFIPGPIQSDGIDFNKVWKIKGEDIKSLIDDLSDGTQNLPIPDDILSWPAKGNPFYNGKLDNIDLAPFRDINGDGKYSPKDGDYPIIGNDIEHVIPLEILYSVSHIHELYYINLEFQTLMYTLSCDEKSELNNTIFTRHYVNLNEENNETFYFSFFFDQDIGCPADDYAGFDINTQTAYSYNRDIIDGLEDFTCGKSENIMNDTPTQGTTLLSGTFNSFMSLDGLVGHPEPMGIYSNLEEIHILNLMQGKWRDGTPLTNNGYGYNPSSTDTTKFAYTGNPVDGTGWIQNLPDSLHIDHRGVVTSKFKNVKPNDIIVVDMAHHFALDSTLDNIQMIIPLLNQAKDFRELYANKFDLTCFSYLANEDSHEKFVVYPNPTTTTLNLVGDYNDSTYLIYNILGQKVDTGIVVDNTIDVSNLNQGIYILVIKNGDITSSVKFIVE